MIPNYEINNQARESVFNDTEKLNSIENNINIECSKEGEVLKPDFDFIESASFEALKQTANEKINENKRIYVDDNGKEYRVGNDLIPNNTFEINGYKTKTDDLGRIVSKEGTIHLKEHKGKLPIKDSMESIGKGDERPGDDRGHLIGDQLGGSNGLENLVPQDAKINQNDYKAMENNLADEVKKGKEVYIKVEPIYNGDSRRPTEIAVTYTIEGKKTVRIFPNERR